MKLLTKAQREQLLANGRNRDGDHPPVVRFFNPCGTGTWLFAELSEDGDTLFGLCDLGEPELGYASLSEIASLRLRFGLGIERDLHFKPVQPLSVYAEAARAVIRMWPQLPQAPVSVPSRGVPGSPCPRSVPPPG